MKIHNSTLLIVKIVSTFQVSLGESPITDITVNNSCTPFLDVARRKNTSLAHFLHTDLMLCPVTLWLFSVAVENHHF